MKNRMLAVLLVVCLVIGNASSVFAQKAEAGDAFSPSEESFEILEAEEEFSISEDPEEPEEAFEVFGEFPEEPEVIEQIPAQSSVTADGSDEPDNNDELFEVYLEQEIFEIEPAKASDDSGNRLSGLDKVFYTKLKNYISQVAAGDRIYTTFEIPLEELALEKTSWTAEELGVEAIATDNGITQEAVTAVYSHVQYNLGAITNALLLDCPYELYWYDKTRGVITDNFTIGASSRNGEWTICLNGKMTFGFFVDAGYQAAESDLVLPSYNQYFIQSEPTDFTIDPVAVNTAKTAAAYAQSIVDTYKNSTNLEKLTAYKNEICNLVSYDDNAREGHANDMNPWQLVSVFDQDPSTNVVCEGYSKAFQYLCELSDFSGGIVSRLATGDMDGGTGAGAHMWNIVHMDDGKNYLVDVTNCDTGTIGADDLLFLKGAAGGDPASGYYYNCHGSNIYFIYDEDTLGSFSTEELTLSMEDYDPSAVPEPVPTSGTCGSDGDNIIWEIAQEGTEIVLTLTGSGKMYTAYTQETQPWAASREQITKIVVGDGITQIGPNSFSGFTALTSIDLPGTLRMIGSSAFSGCSALTELSLPDGLTSIGPKAFSDCIGLTTVFIPETVISPGSQVFLGCSPLTLTFGGTQEYWEEHMYSALFSLPSGSTLVFLTRYYTVTFNGNGAEGTIAPRQVKEGDPYGELPEPTRAEYTFLGWFTQAEGGEPVVSADICTAEITLYAHWQKNAQMFWIYFSAGEDGSVDETSRQCLDGEPFGELPVPVWEGHSFLGWFDANDIQITAETICTGSITVFAKWTEQQHVHQLIHCPAEEPSAGEDGHIEYWYCEGCHGLFLDAQGTQPATWEEIRIPAPVIHIITFDGNGTGMVSEPSRNIEEGKPYGELPEAERTGYRFLGWFTQPEGGETITAATICTGDATVYAHWIRTYWIFFEPGANAAVDITQKEMDDGSAYGTLPVPTWEGFTFAGWYGSDGKVTATTTHAAADGDVYLYGRWIPTITLKNKTATYTGKAISIGKASTPSEGTITYTYYTDADCTKKTTTATGASGSGKAPKNAGTYYVKATVAANGEFDKAVSKAAKLTIKKADQTLSLSASTVTLAVGKSKTITVDGAKTALSYKSASTTYVTVAAASSGCTLKTEKARNKTTTKITVTAEETANYNGATATITVKTTPAATGSLTAANKAGGVQLTWKKVAGATGYYVYRGGKQIAKIETPDTLTYLDTGAKTNGTKYTFKVYAYNSFGKGAVKTVVQYFVSKPASVKVTSPTAKQAKVTWAKNDKATGYQIWYGTNKNFSSGTYKTEIITKNTQISKVFKNLTSGKTYYVKIQACKTADGKTCWSAWSATGSVKIR